MALHPGTKEQLYSDIAEAGLATGFLVVPEFEVYHLTSSGARAAKRADMAWINIGDANAGFELVAVFEIEGFDVPMATIAWHSEVYANIETAPPSGVLCYVPLYSFAMRRRGYGSNAEVVARCIGERVRRAKNLGSIVQVCDGADRSWLNEARELVGRMIRSCSPETKD